MNLKRLPLDALGDVTVPTWLAGERRGELAPLGFGA
jgi:hypothetical protein